MFNSASLTTLPFEIFEQILSYVLPEEATIFVSGGGKAILTSVVTPNGGKPYCLTACSRVHPRLTMMWAEVFYGKLEIQVINSVDATPFVSSLGQAARSYIRHVSLYINYNDDFHVPGAIEACARNLTGLRRLELYVDYPFVTACLDGTRTDKALQVREIRRLEAIVKRPGALLGGRVGYVGSGIDPMRHCVNRWIITSANYLLKPSDRGRNHDFDLRKAREALTTQSRTRRSQLQAYHKALSETMTNQCISWFKSAKKTARSKKNYTKSMHEHHREMMSLPASPLTPEELWYPPSLRTRRILTLNSQLYPLDPSLDTPLTITTLHDRQLLRIREVEYFNLVLDTSLTTHQIERMREVIKRNYRDTDTLVGRRGLYCRISGLREWCDRIVRYGNGGRWLNGDFSDMRAGVEMPVWGC